MFAVTRLVSAGCDSDDDDDRDGCHCHGADEYRGETSHDPIMRRGASRNIRAPLKANLPPREDRDPAARLFPNVSGDRLRTAIARACKAAGVPVFSPHDLRHRRISLLHRQGRSWAEIARFVGQRKLSITADTYTHVLVDGREIDAEALIGGSSGAYTGDTRTP